MIQSLVHLLSGAHLLAYSHSGCLLDIKPDNLLYKISHHSSNEYLHPVFIDFSERFVINSKEKMKKFLTWVTKVNYYPILPPEILIQASIRNIKYKNDIFYKNINKQLKLYHNFDIDNPEDVKYGKDLMNFLNHQIEINPNVLYDKFMAYQIGLSFRYILDSMKNPDKKFYNLITSMTANSIFTRPTMKDIVEIIQRDYSHITGSLIKMDKQLYKKTKIKKEKNSKTQYISESESKINVPLSKKQQSKNIQSIKLSKQKANEHDKVIKKTKNIRKRFVNKIKKFFRKK